MSASACWAWLDGAGFQTMRVLLSLLWQSSILLAAAALLSGVLRRRRASVRCAVWIVALLVVPMLPLLNWAASSVGSPQAAIPAIPAYTRTPHPARAACRARTGADRGAPP